MKKFLVVLYLMLLFLHIFDFYSTYTVLTSGIGVEDNPILEWLMEYIGVVPAMLFTKGLFLILLTILLLIVLNRKSLTLNEYIVIYGGNIILVIYYIYFMYTRNLQILMS